MDNRLYILREGDEVYPTGKAIEEIIRTLKNQGVYSFVGTIEKVSGEKCTVRFECGIRSRCRDTLPYRKTIKMAHLRKWHIQEKTRKIQPGLDLWISLTYLQNEI